MIFMWQELQHKTYYSNLLKKVSHIIHQKAVPCNKEKINNLTESKQNEAIKQTTMCKKVPEEKQYLLICHMVQTLQLLTVCFLQNKYRKTGLLKKVIQLRSAPDK